MNKLFTKIATACVGLAMAIGVGVSVGSNNDVIRANAESSVTFNLTGDTNRTVFTETQIKYASGDASFTIDKEKASTRTDNYCPGGYTTDTNTQTRIYNGSVTTFAVSSSYVITKIEVTATGSNYFAGLDTVAQYDPTPSISKSGSVATVTFAAAVQANSVSADVNNTGRLTAIKIYYDTPSGGDKEDVTLSVSSGSSSMNIGASQTLTVSAKDSNNQTVSGLTYSFASGTTSVATVGESTGVVNALSEGTTAITITSDSTDKYKGGYVVFNITVIDPNAVVKFNFPADDVSETTSYSSSFVATHGDYSLNIVNFNTNSAKWTYIACGQKSTGDASVATMTTSAAMSSRITSIGITFVTANTNGLNSSTLYVASSADFDENNDTVYSAISFTPSANSTVTINIPNSTSAANLFYKIEFDCNAFSSNNGWMQISAVKFVAAPVDELQSLAISGAIPTYTAGSPFSFGRTATAHYSISGDAPVTSGLSFTLGGTAISVGDTIPVSKVGTRAIVVTYTDDNNDSVSAAAYNVTVNYKGAETIALNVNEASLTLGGTVSLTATVTDQYADPNAITWSTSSSSIATVSAESGTKTITVTGVGDGNATITATANGHSATCTVSVSSAPVLNLFDSNDDPINGATLDFFTGDAAVNIHAVSENVASPVFAWNNEDNSVVTISTSTNLCQVTIVGAGESDVSVTVGALTRIVTFRVAQSGVTSLTLTSSVVSGEIYDGTHQNTLTLTPNITKQGNATNVINWSSDDTSVATVSSASTSGTAITVTGKGEGTAVITARSAYTPATFVEYTVNVLADGVTEFSWTNKPYFDSDSSKSHIQIYANDTTLAQIAAAGSSSYGTFAPTWASGKSDSPSFGTGANDVHLVLSATVVNSEEGLTPLSASSTFTKNDNGKYVLAFYQGVRAKGTMPTITVINWRSVKESNASTALYDFSSIESSSTTAMNATTFNTYYKNTSTLAKGSASISRIYADVQSDTGCIKGGASSNAASISITFASTVEISSVTIKAKQYNGTETKLNLMGNEITLTNSMAEYTLTVADEDFATTNVFSLTTSGTSNNKRCYIESITIVAGGEQEIGKTADCLNLEKFIDKYLRSDLPYNPDPTLPVNQTTECESLYPDAKAAFNGTSGDYKLNDHQRELFAKNSAYANELARLTHWAEHNGDKLNNSNQLTEASRVFGVMNNSASSATTAIVVISSVSVLAIGGYFFLRKKKVQ